MKYMRFKREILAYILGSLSNFFTYIFEGRYWIVPVVMYSIGLIIIIIDHRTEIRKFFSELSWNSILNGIKKPSLSLILFIALIIGIILVVVFHQSPDITITFPLSKAPVAITSLENTIFVGGELSERLARKNMFIYVYKFDENRENPIYQINQPDKDGKWKVQISLQPGKNILVAVAINDARTEFYDKEIYQSKDLVVFANLEEK